MREIANHGSSVVACLPLHKLRLADDFLSIGGTYYDGTNCPRGNVSGGTTIRWTSDGSVTRDGWMICVTPCTPPSPSSGVRFTDSVQVGVAMGPSPHARVCNESEWTGHDLVCGEDGLAVFLNTSALDWPNLPDCVVRRLVQQADLLVAREAREGER